MSDRPPEPFDWSADAPTTVGDGSSFQRPPDGGSGHRWLWIVLALLLGLPALAILLTAGLCVFAIMQSSDPAADDERELERLRRYSTAEQAWQRDARIAEQVRRKLTDTYGLSAFHVPPDREPRPCSGGRIPAVSRESGEAQSMAGIPDSQWGQVEATLAPALETEGFVVYTRPRTATRPAGADPSTGPSGNGTSIPAPTWSPNRAFLSFRHRQDSDVISVRLGPTTGVSWRSTCHLLGEKTDPSQPTPARSRAEARAAHP